MSLTNQYHGRSVIKTLLNKVHFLLSLENSILTPAMDPPFSATAEEVATRSWIGSDKLESMSSSNQLTGAVDSHTNPQQSSFFKNDVIGMIVWIFQFI